MELTNILDSKNCSTKQANIDNLFYEEYDIYKVSGY